MMFGVLPPRKERTTSYRDKNLLEIKKLKVVTYRLTIEGIDFSLREGEVLGLAGLEGSGQGLLLRACAGLEDIDSGQVIVDGEDMTGFSYHLGRGPYNWFVTDRTYGIGSSRT